MKKTNVCWVVIVGHDRFKVMAPDNEGIVIGMIMEILIKNPVFDAANPPPAPVLMKLEDLHKLEIKARWSDPNAIAEIEDIAVLGVD